MRKPTGPQFIDLSGSETKMRPLNAASSTSVSDDSGCGLEGSFFQNLSQEAGYGSPPTPPLSRRAPAVISLVDDDEDDRHDAGARKVASRPPPVARPPVPVPAAAVSRPPPPPVPAPAPAAKKKKVARKRTEAEKMADLKLSCCMRLADSHELREGLRSTQFPPANLAAVGAVTDEITFRVESSNSVPPHVVRVMQGKELLEAVAVDAATGDVDCAQLSVMISSLQEKHKDKRVTLLVVAWDKGVQRCTYVKDKKEGTRVLDQVTTLLQCLFGCNVIMCAALMDAGIALGKIAMAIASHLDDDNAASAFSFCLDGAGGRGKKSSDKREVWTNMLMVIPGVSRTRATAIAMQYESMSQLMRRYRDAALTEADKKMLLSAIVLESDSKRNMTVGPKVSERIYHVFTSRDGSQIIKQDKGEDKSKPAAKKAKIKGG